MPQPTEFERLLVAGFVRASRMMQLCVFGTAEQQYLVRRVMDKDLPLDERDEACRALGLPPL